MGLALHKGKHILLAVILLHLSVLAFCQPANDNCNNPSVINISNGGFGLGTFNSSTNDISAATIEPGETFAPAILVGGLNKKSMWYKFTVPTTRALRVTLVQPGIAITAGDAGFAVYKSINCDPADSELSTKLTPIGTFGNTYHPCVDSGIYLVQVSANNKANGPLFIQLQITDSTGAVYDHPTNAYQFGVLSPGRKSIDYNVDCQSIEDATEVCTALSNYTQYDKSTWHTFTTPAYLDYLSIFVAYSYDPYPNRIPQTIGYSLYKGDATKTPISGLTVVDGCDSISTDGYNAAMKSYPCQTLLPNTTYSIQLFFKYNFNNSIRVGVAMDGTQPTALPQPILPGTALPSNQLGTIPSSANGVTTYASDYLACNALHSSHPCNPSLPDSGINVGGYWYNLSSFFTFSLSSTCYVNSLAYENYCGPNLYVRLFKQGLTKSCTGLDTANLIGGAGYQFGTDCLPPGDYTLQVLGVDSMTRNYPYSYGDISSTGYPLCQYSNLGEKLNVQITAYNRVAYNHYSLVTAGAYDTINNNLGMQPLQPGFQYNSNVDTFGCKNTVYPNTQKCDPSDDKTMYREFQINKSPADSGILTMYYNGDNAGGQIKYHILYQGDADAYATIQNARSYPDTLAGLVPYSQCRYNNDYCLGDKVCVIPGTYTLATTAGDNLVGHTDNVTVKFTYCNTIHYDSSTVQNLGSIIDSIATKGGSTVTSDLDYFSCKDNADTINGYAPCSISGKPASKAIYRQFYLSQNAVININGYHADPDLCGYSTNGGYMTLFAGKASNGLSTLTPVGNPWNCFFNAGTSTCAPVDSGWYTVVSYGSGPSYDNPLRDLNQNGYGSYTGRNDQFTITVTVACPGPKFDRPYKASIDTSTNQPYLIAWNPRVGNTVAYPKTDTTYTLATENFNCTTDTPFSKLPIVTCAPNMDKVAYYVFNIPKVSYVQIDTKGYWAEVFNKDVRTVDSLQFAAITPVQPCIQASGFIQLCKLQPGTYTLVVFAGDNTSGSCANVTPTIYVDQVGYSRFDFAHNAYDFGVVPPDSIYHNGKVGDVNPLNATRAPSNDFLYCTTGSEKSDPTESSCDAFYNANIYNARVNNYLYDNVTSIPNYYEIPRRNLWYTFVVNQPGYVTVKVDNKTLGKQDPGGDQYPFEIYKSNVNGTLPFTSIVSSGLVDSVIASPATAKGLTAVAGNLVGYYCYGTNTAQFYRDPCTLGTDRYYIVVDNRNPYAYASINAMNPNSQVEVSILVDSVHFPFPKYDHYSEAYNFGTISPPAGVVNGGTDNFSCATADATDPIKYYSYCAQKTLWYKFQSGVTGHVRYRININGNQYTDQSNVQLFTQTKAGDSTSAGLIFQNVSGISDANGYWATNCVEPNTTYYLVVTGCSRVNEYIFPQIEMAEDSGDFCGTPIVANLAGPGTNTSTAVIDCHTIGTDYGEFNPTLTCPAGAQTNSYKSSWYKINIGGTDTLDVTAYLDEKTTAPPSQIQYRLMTGDCGAMQEQSCVQDAQTQNTYKCLAPGGYFIQVFTPVIYNNSSVTGTIDLKLSAIKHADTCAPLKTCLANANFGYTYNCKTDTAVRFINFSTYGSSIIYKWDFGYNHQTSTAVSPAFPYPASAGDSIYNVRLIATNTSCGGADTAYGTVKVPAHPYVNLGPDIRQCSSTGSVSFNATQPFPGAVYSWQDGSSSPTYTATVANQGIISVTINFASCAITDTVSVYINSIAKRVTQRLAFCPGDSVKLDASYGKGETYIWKNGTKNSFIYAKAAGTYWADVSLNGCTFRDSFIVTAISAVHPLGNDTTICVSTTSPYKVDATTGDAVSYKWKDGTTNPLHNITAAGIYWVDINFGTTCIVRDSVVITAATTTAPIITGKQSACYSDSTLLDAGSGYLKYLWSTGDTVEKVYAKATGNYNVKITDKHGCIAKSKNVSVTISPKVIPVTVSKIICFGNTYTLPSGKIVAVSNTYNDTVKSVLLGCDSVVTRLTLSVLKPVKTDTSVIICFGNSYTLPSGKIVNTANIYNDTVRSIGNCDSIITNLTLKVIKATRPIIDTVICAGATFKMPAGAIVSAANTYSDTLKSRTGCDSVITTVNLKVFTPTRPVIDTTICAGATFRMPAGRIVSTANTYIDTLKSKSGCDSVITTVNLKIFTPIHPIIDTVICDGLTYAMPAGKVISIAGTYIDTLKNANGCDSVITTVHLEVFTATRQVIDKAICDGQSYTMPAGAIVSATGTYIDTLKNNNGCDSMITTLHLKVNPVQKIFNNVSICIGQTYTLPSGTVVNTSGTYTSNLKNQFGCDSIIITTVSQNNPLVIHLAGTTPICKGQPTSLSAQVSGGNSSNYKYTWNVSSTTNSSLIFTPQTTTKVIVSVTDGCTPSPAKDSIIIEVVPLPVPQFSVTTNGVCEPVIAMFSNQTTPAGNTNTYNWNFGDNNVSTVTNPTYTYQSAGIYTVSLVATVNGCSDTITKTNVVNVYAAPVASFTTDPSPNTIDNSQITFINKSSNGSSWLWNFGDDKGVSVERSPIYVYANAGQYVARLIVKNDQDCIDTTSQLITIIGSDGIYIPNAFTPNGDGENDVFRVKGIGVTVTEMSIYSRWGKRVFYTTANPAEWNGKDQSTGTDCDQAAYVYIIKVTLKDGSSHLYKGNIVLVR